MQPLTIDNTLWANTVVCGGSAVGLVVYAGAETRAAMNCDPPTSKVDTHIDMYIHIYMNLYMNVYIYISIYMYMCAHA